MGHHKEKKDRKVDTAGDMTFPASDPTTHGKPTSNEPPKRPVDRKGANHHKGRDRAGSAWAGP